MVVSPLEQLISELVTQPSLKSTKAEMEKHDCFMMVHGNIP
jgi:hypothetical protein